jgi:hypothetical protein
MYNNLFLPYGTGDTGARPLQGNPNFWSSPAVVLATPDGNYTVGQPTTINVQVSLMLPQTYQYINVEVWVGNPTSNFVPSNSLPVAQGGTNGQYLEAVWTPPTPGQTIGPVLIPVTGFVPYAGLSNLPGGHACLYANCWGMTSGNVADGADLTEQPQDNLNTEVQNNQHVAQRNIFADVASPGPHMKVINFPFLAQTSLSKGAEQVRLQITERSPAQLQSLLHSGLLRLGGPKFKGLPIAVSERPVKFFGLTGLPKGGRMVELELEAHKSQVLTATAELDPAEKPGAAHAFDVVQRDARGKTQGGLTLVTVVPFDREFVDPNPPVALWPASSPSGITRSRLRRRRSPR